jgi:hypothetical protein
VRPVAATGAEHLGWCGRRLKVADRIVGGAGVGDHAATLARILCSAEIAIRFVLPIFLP